MYQDDRDVVDVGDHVLLPEVHHKDLVLVEGIFRRNWSSHDNFLVQYPLKDSCHHGLVGERVAALPPLRPGNEMV